MSLSKLSEQLRLWRDRQAATEGVPAYRVLPNAVLLSIAQALPSSREELCALKGFKEAKYRKYGRAILELVAHQSSGGLFGNLSSAGDADNQDEQVVTGGILEAVVPTPVVPNQVAPVPSILSVSQYLDEINLELSGMAARIEGEVSSVSESAKAIYFSLKDASEGSVLNCIIFRYQYELSGVKLAEGDQIIVEGVPEVYKPYGKLSFKVGMIEYAGEGALKKAYDALYQKLQEEGVFASEVKRPIPLLPDRIALITSQDGAALGDFTTNLVRAGMKIDHYPTLVEGKRAVSEIIQAIQYFNRTPDRYAVLVLIRGGGSLESLQAFNTEAMVRAVRSSYIPVLAGIGHERDVSLVALAADQMVSTPTATARTLSHGWEEARLRVEHQGQRLMILFADALRERAQVIEQSQQWLTRGFEAIFNQVTQAERTLLAHMAIFPELLRQAQKSVVSHRHAWQSGWKVCLDQIQRRLKTLEEKLLQYDPQRALRLGYSLVRKADQVVREARSLQPGDRLDIQLGQGGVESEVKRVWES